MFRYLIIALCLAALLGCSQETAETTKEDPLLSIVATTGMLADVVANIGGDQVEVLGLMGPGVDPHLYKAKPSDLQALRKADLVVYNGLHLEGRMVEVMEKLGERQTVLAVGATISSGQLINYGGKGSDSYDPHIWFDVSMWEQIIQPITDSLSALDPVHQATFRANAQSYRQQLAELHQWVLDTLATIPANQRVLVTAHDAFSYFGRVYKVEVRGLQGISTVAEFGLRDVRELVDFLVSRQIKAVFVESSIPTKSLDAVVAGCKDRGHEIRIGGTLFSDAMGEPGGPAGTYEGMVRTNVRTIVSGLN